MSVRVVATESFKRLAKPLLKKYPSLKREIDELTKELAANPTMGAPLGHRVYKIRLAIRSKGKGKSGGARVVTYLQCSVLVTTAESQENMTTVNLIAIFDKSETDSISDKELKSLIEMVERAS